MRERRPITALFTLALSVLAVGIGLVTAADSPVVLAVEEAWIPEVRALIADQGELARLWANDD